MAEDATPEHRDPAFRARTRCKIFLGYTSNMASCGVREQIRYLAQHRLVDVIVTSAGGVEEDLIKVLQRARPCICCHDSCTCHASGLLHLAAGACSLPAPAHMRAHAEASCADHSGNRPASVSQQVRTQLMPAAVQCLAPSYMGAWKMAGAQLRAQGLNRIGNMLVPNSNYCAFEDWLMPILDAMLEEQAQGTRWTPSKARLLAQQSPQLWQLVVSACAGVDEGATSSQRLPVLLPSSMSAASTAQAADIASGRRPDRRWELGNCRLQASHPDDDLRASQQSVSPWHQC